LVACRGKTLKRATMSSSSSPSSTSELLWQNLMGHLIAKQPSCAAYWKEVSSTDLFCQICAQPGGGAVIRCHDPECRKFYHLECAWHEGGLTIDDKEGSLVFKCKAEGHFETVLFCTCRTPYDKDKNMICCDVCSEWFHYKCVDLNERVNPDKYFCKTCLGIRKRKDITELKALDERKRVNLDKDRASSLNQEALTSLEPIVDVLANTVCDIVDALNDTSLYRFRPDSEVTMMAVEKAVDKLEAFKMKAQAEDADDEVNALRSFGEHKLVDEWLHRLKAARRKFDDWEAKTERELSEIVKAVKPSLDPTQTAALGQLKDGIDTAQKAVAKIHCANTDMEGFLSLADCVHWINEALNIFHLQQLLQQDLPSTELVVSAADRLSKLVSLTRTAISKVKKLNTCASSYVYCEKFLPIFQEFVKKITSMTQEMNEWNKEANKALAGSTFAKHSMLISLIASAKSFPFAPPAMEPLLELHEAAKSLDSNISAALQEQKLNEALIEQLMDDADKLNVTLPITDNLEAVAARADFLKEMNRIEALARNPIEDLEVAKELHEKIPPKDQYSSPLSAALDTHVDAALSRLQASVSEVSDKARAAQTEIENFESTLTINPFVLNALRSSKVITNEEQVIDFLIHAKEILDQAREIVDMDPSSSGFTTTLEEAGKVLAKLELASNFAYDENFAVAKLYKQAIREMHDQLFDEIDSSSKFWYGFQENIAAFADNRGNISAEELAETLALASTNKFTNDGVVALAKELQLKARDVAESCRSTLSTITEVHSGLQRCAAMHAETTKVPLEKELLSHIKRLHSLCQTVVQCETLCTQQKEASEGAGGRLPVRSIGIREIASYRELKRALDSLAVRIKDQEELKMLAPTKEMFPLLHWRADVRHCLDFRSPLADVEKLAVISAGLGPTAEALPEHSDMLNELAAGRAFAAECQAEIAHLESVRTLTNSAFANHSSSGSGTDTGHEPFFSAVEKWTQAMQGKEDVYLHLKEKESQQVLSNPDALDALADCSSLRNNLSNGAARFAAIQAIMAEHQSEAEAARAASNKKFNHVAALTQKHVVDLRELSNLSNALRFASEGDSSFILLQSLAEKMRNLLSEANSWNEAATRLLPIKNTRGSSKYDQIKTISKADLEATLCVPIAKAIMMPMHEQLFQTLLEADSVKSDVKAFLLPGQRMNIEEDEERDPEMELFNDIKRAALLISNADRLPIVIPEVELLVWAKDILTWKQAIPSPDADATEAISMEIARQRLEEADTFLNYISESIVEQLGDLGVLVRETSKFHEDSHEAIRTCGDLYQHLQDQVAKTEKLQEDIEAALSSKKTALLQQYFESISSLLVIPDQSVVRSLKKALGNKTPTSSRGGIIWDEELNYKHIMEVRFFSLHKDYPCLLLLVLSLSLSLLLSRKHYLKKCNDGECICQIYNKLTHARTHKCINANTQQPLKNIGRRRGRRRRGRVRL